MTLYWSLFGLREEISDKSNLSNKSFVLTHGVKGNSPSNGSRSARHLVTLTSSSVCLQGLSHGSIPGCDLQEELCRKV